VKEDFADGKIKKVSTFTEKSAALQISNGAAKIKQVYKLFIDDEKKIPREYLVPDESAIITAMKEGKKVAGCTYKKVKSISI
jgi:hypothetical protein